jgi:hypothetical protein
MDSPGTENDSGMTEEMTEEVEWTSAVKARRIMDEKSFSMKLYSFSLRAQYSYGPHGTQLAVDRSPASRRRQLKGNSVPEGITVPPYH